MKNMKIVTALWMPDLFMSHVKDDLDWYLFSPNDCPGLPDVYSDEFENLLQICSRIKICQKVKARKWGLLLKVKLKQGHLI